MIIIKSHTRIQKERIQQIFVCDRFSFGGFMFWYLNVYQFFLLHQTAATSEAEKVNKESWKLKLTSGKNKHVAPDPP